MAKRDAHKEPLHISEEELDHADGHFHAGAAHVERSLDVLDAAAHHELASADAAAGAASASAGAKDALQLSLDDAATAAGAPAAVAAASVSAVAAAAGSPLPPPPPPLPLWFEKATSFRSRAPARDLFARVLLALEREQLLAEVQADTFVIKTVAQASDGTSVPVEISVFSSGADDDAALVVEFLRVSGDVVAFTAFFRKMTAALLDLVAVEERPTLERAAEAAARGPTLGAMSLPLPLSSAPLMQAPAEPISDRDALNLIKVAKAGALEVAREGARAVARATEVPRNQPVFMRIVGLADEFRVLLGHADVDVARGVATALANMTTLPAFCTSLDAGSLELVAATFARTTDLETRRQLAVAVGRIAATRGADLRRPAILAALEAESQRAGADVIRRHLATAMAHMRI
jgi:hypothetical protein